ncbi:hypothetical protein B2K_38590 [Paenibacillus mucilaginosus K02]|uniref:Uncharacterized protein n=1 Tax=Paenibacillus mucilaginosus K02 TaxID=997761 RepID=R9UPM7_9BACL|nr:hypothetical protein B2K_38590 [Paenibacillus mucilaginosus K02]
MGFLHTEKSGGWQVGDIGRGYRQDAIPSPSACPADFMWF